MTDIALPNSHDPAPRRAPDAFLQRRHAAERRFRLYGIIAVLLGLSFLFVLMASIFAKAYTVLWLTNIRLEITFVAAELDPDGSGDPAAHSAADYAGLVKRSLRELFPNVSGRRDKRALYRLASQGAVFEIRQMVLADPTLVGKTRRLWLPASDAVDMYRKGFGGSGEGRRLKDNQVAWVEALVVRGAMESQFNWRFFASGDSREPELAGILSALLGSLFSLAICLLISLPMGVTAAIYLEEFAPKNRWTDLIEVNVNNLAAVPSIVFGLLGLAVLLNFVGIPRSVPLAGGIVLALMTLPTIIITSRAALKSVPIGIREAALGIGASTWQVVQHHVLPVAMPGILTGTIIGMARALGETAPLLMIGMVAFIADLPTTPLDPATALPVQIYIWADSPERAFVERSAAAIVVLVTFLVCMNLTAVLLRKKFEQRW